MCLWHFSWVRKIFKLHSTNIKTVGSTYFHDRLIVYFTLWDEAEEPGQPFWPILYVPLVIFFKSNGFSAFKSKNSPARTIEVFLLLCSAELRDRRNPFICIAELSGVSEEERVRKNAHNPFFVIILGTFWHSYVPAKVLLLCNKLCCVIQIYRIPDY